MKLALAALVIIVLGAGALTLLRIQNSNEVNENYAPVLENENTGSAVGVIQGSLSFPSETIPSDMIVCAEEIGTINVICTSNQISDEQFTYRVGYSLAVPPGNYYVYAYLPQDSDRKAYYNEFVTCGLSVDCKSHEPIEVQVTTGEIVSGIDPQDWYQIPEPQTTPETFPEGQI